MDWNDIEKNIEADLRRFKNYSRKGNEENLRKWVREANLMYLTRSED